MIDLRGLGLSMAFLWAGPLSAHEFWVEAIDYTVDVGAEVQAELRVGEDFAGSTYPFVPQRFKVFRLTAGGVTADYVGRAGDSPAAQIGAAVAGLNILSYHSQPDTLRFTKRCAVVAEFWARVGAWLVGW